MFADRLSTPVTRSRTSPRSSPAIADVPCSNILGLVIYDLPGRDCAAKASNGELKVGEVSKYKSTYIDRKSNSSSVASSSGGRQGGRTSRADAGLHQQPSSSSSRPTPTRPSPWSSSPILCPTW